MNLQHLRYAVEVERTGSITEAAENLFITQPSLSKAIRELENASGVTIFERTSRGVLPTPKGRELLSRARAILRQVDGIEALSRKGDSAREFSLAAPLGGYIAQGVSRFIAGLDFSAPVNASVKTADFDRALGLISRGEVNLAIVRYPANEEIRAFDEMNKREIKHEHIWEFECVLLFSAKSPLASAQELTPECFNGLCEISAGEKTHKGGGSRVTVSDERAAYELLSVSQNAYAWAPPMPPELMSRYSLVQRGAKSGMGAYRDALVCLSDYAMTDTDRAFIDRLFETRNRAAFSDAY